MMMNEVPILFICVVVFGVVCATGCDRNATHVVCERSTRTNPLLDIHDARSLRQTDTIVVHNAHIDLSADLIDLDITLPRVSLLDLRNNGIERIGRRGLDKTHSVEYLYLSHNRISHVQPDPLLSLTRLRLLEMNDAIDGSDGNERAQVLSDVFTSKNQLVDLTEVQLNGNNLTKVHDDTFCKVKGLKRLELSDNQLNDVAFTRKCFGNVEALFLAGNSLTQIDDDLWDWMPSLTSLDISRNPINCDCTIMPFLRIALEEKINFLNQEKTLCASPPDVAGKSVFSLPHDYCSHSSSGHTLLHFLFLVVVAAVVLIGYRRYREKLARLAAYQSIEREVQPQFV